MQFQTIMNVLLGKNKIMFLRVIDVSVRLTIIMTPELTEINFVWVLIKAILFSTT